MTEKTLTEILNDKMQAIENSSNVSGCIYEAAERELYIRYKNGDIYRYSDVDFELYERFRASESKGSFVFQHIKGKFTVEKVKNNT